MKKLIMLIGVFGLFSTSANALSIDKPVKVVVEADATYNTNGQYYRAETTVTSDGFLNINLKKYKMNIFDDIPYDEGVMPPYPMEGFVDYAQITAPLLNDEYEYIINRVSILAEAETKEIEYGRCLVVPPRIVSYDYMSILRSGELVTVMTACYTGARPLIFEDPSNYEVSAELFEEIMRITDKVTANARGE